MASVVCQHCQETILPDEAYAVHEKFSYHKKCNRCYVCGESNLHNAELFKGVIFCSSCSQRIFQGCSTARKTKSRHRDRRARSITRHNRKERSRMQDRRNRSRAPIPPGIIALARMGAAAHSEYDSDSKDMNESKPVATTAELALTVQKNIFDTVSYKNTKDLKKDSAETGMTTEVTEQLLRQMKCPVVEKKKHDTKAVSPINTYMRRRTRYWAKRRKNEQHVSDMRIAELGASTEIANMALRKHSEVIIVKSTEITSVPLKKQSELPVVIKSWSRVNRLKDDESLNVSVFNQDSVTSGDCNDDWLESSSSLKESLRKYWSDRRFRSLLIMPYKCFKKNIINRSSLITLVKRKKRESNMFVKRLKIMFNESTVEHQDRGLKRLYSTINRRKTPYKMGWLDLMVKMSRVITQPRERRRPEILARNFSCKHFKRSHSYRCMRSLVMKRAGPTKSELALFRMKIKNMLTPSFLKDVLSFNKPSSMISQACGSEPLSSKK